MRASTAGTRIGTLFALLMMAALVVDCGGGSGATPPGVQTVGQSAAVKFVVEVPSNPAPHSKAPRNLSSSAQSVVVTLVQAPAPPSPTSVAIDLQPGSTDCKAVSKGKVCSRTMTVPVGEEQFTVFVYTRPGGSGALLAAGPIPPTQVQAGGSDDNLNTVLLTLSSIVKSIKLNVAPGAITVGVKKIFALTLTAYDATGAIILAPGKYSPAILIQLNDPKGFFGGAPFPRFVNGPRPALGVLYDQSAIQNSTGGYADFTASGGTLEPASVRVTFKAVPPTPSPTPSPTPTPGLTPTPSSSPSSSPGNTPTPTPLPTLTPVPTFAPSPTPSPRPTPVPQFNVTPTTLTFAGTAPQPTQTFSASETGVNSFTATSENPSIATVSGSGTTFTVTAGSTSGQTLIDVKDPSNRKATVTVIVSGQVIIIQTKPRTRHP